MKLFVRILLVLGVQSLFCNALLCKDTTQIFHKNDTIYYREAFSPEDIIIKYKTILDNDAKEHREYIQNLYSTITIAFGAICTVILTFLTNSLLKTRKEIKSWYIESIKNEVDKITQEEKCFIENEYKLRLRNFTAFTNKLLIDVATKSVITLEDKPLEYVNYENLREKMVLWVDDKPFNNREPREMLESFEVKFVLASTTNEAIDLLNSSKEKFHLIISNLGRPNEKGKENPTEGITFLQKIKDKRIPKIIYTKPDNVERYGKEVEAQGSSIAQGYSQLFKEILKTLAVKSI